MIFGIIAEENTALLICLSAPGTGPRLHVSSASSAAVEGQRQRQPRALPGELTARGISSPRRRRRHRPALSRALGAGRCATGEAAPKGLTKFGLPEDTSAVGGTRFESLLKRHVIASDSLYYHNSSKLIGFRFMEKYANAERTTHIPHCGVKVVHSESV